MSADPFRSIDNPSWTVRYYHDHEILVTRHYIQVGRNRYPAGELSDLRTASGPLHPGVTISLVIALVQAPLAVPVVAVVRSPLAYLLAVLALVVPGVVALVCARRFPPQQRLLAEYRGEQVILFGSHDEQRFGKVARAVLRAVESQRLLD
jgi:Family of unknown function (DUF6232)